MINKDNGYKKKAKYRMIENDRVSVEDNKSSLAGLIMIVIMINVLLTIVSVAVMHFGVKSVLARAVLHRSNIAVWFLHSILPEHVRACKTSTYELFVLRCSAQSWHIWDTRYRSFLRRRIEF